MNAKSAIASYKAHYEGMSFERLGLFKLLRDTYGGRDVLYPGCSIHITPSFVFPHVVYVDKSAQAKAFFSNQQEVLGFVARNRDYKRQPFVQFFQQDYSASLPLQKESFDLLLSFFAGKVVPACGKYLRHDGLLVTNRPGEVDSDAGFELMATIRFQGGKYRFLSAAAVSAEKAPKNYLRQSHRGLEYVEHESYSVFGKSP